jgi:tetratricopeptide (TPR) repeat protein
MRFRSLVSVFIVVLLICFAAALHAQDAPQPAPAADAQVSSAFAQATVADKAKHPDQAAQILWNLVDQFPNHPQAPKAAKQAAYLTDKLKDRDQSIAAFKRALELYPNSEYAPVLKRCLALNYEAKGDKGSAISEFRDLVARFPRSDAACFGLVNLGLLYVSQVAKDKTDAANWQLKDDADAAFKQVVDTFPAKRDMCAKAELYRAGIAFERALANRISWDAAIKQVQSVKRAYPGADPGILARLELMSIENDMLDHKYADVAANAEKLIEAYPTCKLELGWARLLAGDARTELGEYDNAMAHYQAVINGKYTPADNFAGRDVTTSAMVSIGDCYNRMGQPGKAKEVWQSLIAGHAGSWDAEVAQRRLDLLKGGK